MVFLILLIFGITALQGYLAYLFLERKWSRRLLALECELQQFSEAICQMAEMQMKSYRKLCGNLGDMEERIMDLSLPSEDPDLPLERRHRVLALARKGSSIDEIVKKLNLPRGEAELILNLRGFVDAKMPKAASTAEEARDHAQA